LAPPDDLDFLKTARAIYRQQEKYAQALNLSIRVGDMELIKEDFEQCPDP
jgi:26S proteasome regulatory subunit N1